MRAKSAAREFRSSPREILHPYLVGECAARLEIA
jgi:hypothetical protein